MLFGSKERRIFAVGDIHGCKRELEALLAKIKPRKQDLVVFLGDYVDRGPDSRGVVDVILQLQSKCDVVALKGNHEEMLIEFLERPASPGAGLFVMNGGTATLANYGGADGSWEFPKSHIDFLYGLKLFHETEDYFFVHAGVPNGPLSLINAEEDGEYLVWARQPFLSSDYDWGKRIIHGHTPVHEVEVKKNRVNLDTGCVYGGMLTAIELPSGKLFQVPGKSKGMEPKLPKEADSQRSQVRFSGRIPVTAGRPGEPQRSYETMNYNQFGLLIRDKLPGGAFVTGDLIEGMIGADPQTGIRFEGVVARTESKGEMFLYGVRIQRISSGPSGWIERPSE